MDTPIHLGFVVLELSKFLVYETYHDKLQTYFGREYLYLHFMDNDSFVLTVNTKYIVKDSKNLEDVFDFSTLNEDQQIISSDF